MPDEVRQVTEPQQGPKPHQQQKQPQKQPQNRPKHDPGDDDVRDFREQLRRSIADILASISVQEDRITVLANDVHEALDAEGKRLKALEAKLDSGLAEVRRALELTQQTHRFVAERLNEKQKTGAWHGQKWLIAGVCALVVAFLALGIFR